MRHGVGRQRKLASGAPFQASTAGVGIPAHCSFPRASGSRASLGLMRSSAAHFRQRRTSERFHGPEPASRLVRLSALEKSGSAAARAVPAMCRVFAQESGGCRPRSRSHCPAWWESPGILGSSEPTKPLHPMSPGQIGRRRGSQTQGILARCGGGWVATGSGPSRQPPKQEELSVKTSGRGDAKNNQGLCSATATADTTGVEAGLTITTWKGMFHGWQNAAKSLHYPW